MRSRKFSQSLQLVMIILALTGIASSSHTLATQAVQIPGDPLGSFEAAGPPAPLNWTGDGQRIINPSFETGNLSPWIEIRSNARTSSSVVLPGSTYDGSYSVLLTINSGNVSSDSSFSLVNDLTSQQVGFSASIRLRAGFYIENITGGTPSDRAEVTLSLTDSTGFLRTVHYVFGVTSLPANSTSDAYYRITGSTQQWITIDRNIAADAQARFGSEFASLNSVRDVRLSVYSKTTGNDPRIKYFDTNNNFSWDIGEPVIYDGNNDRYYQTMNDQIIDTPPPGASIKTDVKIKFVDTSLNGVRDNSEPVIYDANNNGVYDILEPVIFGTASYGAALSTDSRIKYQDVNNSDTWNNGEAVVSDSNNNDTYDAGDLVLDSPTQSGIPLQDDPRIRFVDGNNDRVFNSGESIIYDANDNAVYDAVEAVIGGATPPTGTRFYQISSSRFDRVELYSATGNFEWIRNNSFETGILAGWGAQGTSFQVTSVRAFSGMYSANATVTGANVDMAQSLDSQPRVESWSRFKASAYVATMTGSSAEDYVDIWLGLIDSSPAANPAFVHYLIKTGDGTIPGNTTSSTYHRVSGFGTLDTWLSISGSLDAEAAYFTTTIYTPPFHVLVIGIQISAQASSRTTAQLDDFSFFGPYHPGPFTQGLASSYRYAVDAKNSTYVYTAAIPHGAFYTIVPRGLSILNITAPGNISIPGNEYATTLSTSGLRIEIPVSTSFRYNPTGDWRFYMTSINAVVTVYPEDPLLRSPGSTFEPGSTANLVSRSRDPFGTPIVGATATLTLWDSSAINVGSWTGTTDAQGWFNMSTATLPSAVGSYRLQATVNATFVGVLTFPFFIGTPPLVADFTFTPAIAIADGPVTFSASASGGRGPYTFSWNFGDQTTGTGSGVTHTYSTKGAYQVSLTVTDAGPTTTTVTHPVSVHYVLSVSLSTSTSQLSAGTPVVITGQVTPAKPDVTVTLSYRVAGDATWTTLGTAITDSTGRFSYTWTPSQGDYELRASVGDSFTAPVESNRGQLIVSGATLFSPLVVGLVVLVAGSLVLAFILKKYRDKNRTSRT